MDWREGMSSILSESYNSVLKHIEKAGMEKQRLSQRAQTAIGMNFAKLGDT